MNLKVIKSILLLSLVILIQSCSDTDSTSDLKFESSGTKALIIYVENSYIISEKVRDLYPILKPKVDSQLAEIFQVSPDTLAKLTLEEIVDYFAEDWQINEIATIADSHYNNITILTDLNSSYLTFIDTLSLLKKNYDIVDVIINTHGSRNSIKFVNEAINTIDIANEMFTKSIVPRIIYLTCCDASTTLNDFTKAGVYAVNGSVGTNYFTLFSPQDFLKFWINGATFSSAVRQAYNSEIEELGYYVRKIHIEDIVLTNENLNSSIQEVKGRFPSLLFKNLRHID